ncbi:MAG: hypothetical protein M3527_01205 [Actinomycetota bacterium]|nr:hypothetical protein [Acidimicrobiia bacterium]MDQ3293059.1 hypothetical protein [Actinomycetota bacterium]
MTGYEFAERLARSLGLPDRLPTSEYDQLLGYLRPVHEAVIDNYDQRAEVLVAYILGRADVSPGSVGQYVDMVAQRAQNLADHEEPWTLLQFAEEMATTMSTSQLTESEASQILDNVDVVGMRAEVSAIPIAAYLIGRGNQGPGDVSGCVSAAFELDG